jgi:ParB-like chromosome segregation protein Spo0J
MDYDIGRMYENYLKMAREKYPSLNYKTNIFQNSDKISEYYGTRQQVTNQFSEQLKLSEEEMANLEQTSVEDYLGNQNAISFLTNNIQYFKNVDTQSSYYKDIDRSVNVLQNLNVDDKKEYFNNKLSNLQKQSLSLLGVKDEDDFSNTLEMLKVGSTAETGVMTETLTDADGNTKEVDVTLSEILKGAGAGALAGAGVGTLFGGPLIGTSIGALVGGITEVADLLSENDIVESVNNARRNFVSAMYGSTIGMIGNASGGIGNAINTLLTNVSDKEVEELQTYNPLSVIEGVTDGIDTFLINQQKDEYSNFSKFLIQDLPSVMGSLAGFAVLGKGLGKVAGTKSVTINNKPLNFFFGGEVSELALRGTVALGAMDETFDNLRARGISNEKAFTSSLLTGGLNWGVLAFTEAGIGKRVERSLSDKFGKFAVKDILKNIPVEMAKEGAEEIGELMSQELGQSLGLGKAEFSSLKDYIYTGFLGAVGGVFGAGVGYVNHRSAIEKSYSELEKINGSIGDKSLIKTVKDNIEREYKTRDETISELELKDKAIAEMQKKGVNGIPDIILKHVLLDMSERFKISLEDTTKYYKETLEPQAIDFLQKQTDLDATKENISKVSFLLNEINTNPSKEVQKELDENLDLYSKLENTDHYNQIASLSKKQKIELKKLSSTQLNKRVYEMVEKGANDFYVELDENVKSKKGKSLDLLRKWNMSKEDIDTMYSNQLIDQDTYNNFNNKYNKEMASIKHIFDKFMSNPSIENQKNVSEKFANKQELFNFIEENYSGNVDEYIRLLDDFNLTNYDKSYKKIVSIGKDVGGVLSYNIDGKSQQSNAEQLQKIKTLKSELKSEYGRLNKVPFELINKLNDNDISLEKLNELEKELSQSLKEQKKETKKKIETKPLKLIKKKGVLSYQSLNEYYKDNISELDRVNDKLRHSYLQNIASEVGSFKSLPSKIKEKYNIKDFNDIVFQNVLDEYKIKENRKKIFPETKVVDSDGNPLTVYHGTVKDFDVFKKTKLGSRTDASDAELGFHFSNNKHVMKFFGEHYKKYILDIKKPVDFSFNTVITKESIEYEEMMFSDLNEIFKEEFNGFDEYDYDVINILSRENASVLKNIITKNPNILEKLKKKGYDGFIFELQMIDQAYISNLSFNSDGKEYIVLYNDQIHQVLETKGENQEPYTVNRKNQKLEDSVNMDLFYVNKLLMTDNINLATTDEFEFKKLIRLAKSIAEEGITEPIILGYDNSEGRVGIIDGQKRLQIANILGLKDIPIRVIVNPMNQDLNGSLTTEKRIFEDPELNKILDREKEIKRVLDTLVLSGYNGDKFAYELVDELQVPIVRKERYKEISDAIKEFRVTKPKGYKTKEEIKLTKEMSKNIFKNTVEFGGSTHGMKYVSDFKSSGYAIATEGNEVKIKSSDFKSNDILDYVYSHENILKSNDNYNIGTWQNQEDGYTYLDISEVYPSDMNIAEVLKIAKERKQLAVFNLETFEEIRVEKDEIYSDGQIEQTKENGTKIGDTSEFKPNYTVGRSNPKIKEYTNVSVDILSQIQDVDRIGQYGAYNSDIGINETIELAKDIAENGFKSFVYIEYNPETGNIVLGEGNHRLQIAQILGLKDIPARVGIGTGKNANFETLNIGKNLVEGGYGRFWDNGPEFETIIKALAKSEERTEPMTFTKSSLKKIRNNKLNTQINNAISDLKKEVIKQYEEEKDYLVELENDYSEKEVNDDDIVEYMIYDDLGLETKDYDLEKIDNVRENIKDLEEKLNMLEEYEGNPLFYYKTEENFIDDLIEIQNKYGFYEKDWILNLDSIVEKINSDYEIDYQRFSKNEGKKTEIIEAIQEFKIDKSTSEEVSIQRDMVDVKNAINGLDVIGVGIDYINGVRQKPIVYYEGDTISEHTFYYDKNQIAKEIYKRNFIGETIDEEGNEVIC